MSFSIKRMVESSILIAIGTVLSIFTFQNPWPLGGGITLCSMLPLVLIAHRYGTPWGIFCALTYSLLQLLLGLNNVQYAPNPLSAFGIIMLDYVLAFTGIGLSSLFNYIIKDRRWAIVFGIVITMLWRYLCHILSGVFIWEALWPNAAGMPALLWSLTYNGSYMLPEMLLTSAVAYISYEPLKKYWMGSDLSIKVTTKEA